MGMSRETDSDDIEAYCPGLDCAVNCNPALLNVEKMTPRYDDPVPRTDPGAGAMTPYHNGTTYVSRHIPVGGELFKDYGQGWFDFRYDIFGEFPMEDSYDHASDLVEQMMELSVSEEVKADLYKVMTTMKKSVESDGRLFPKGSSRTLNALPDDYQDAKWATDNAKGDISELHQAAATRDIAWLRENGKCMDHIRNGPSSIASAGHGAFSKRDMPAGTVISASPLHHVQRSFANLYNFTYHKPTKQWIRIKDQIVGKQLMLNYCFAHPESILLLCPYGAGINYINHGSDPNVKIRWAENFEIGHNASLLEGPLSALWKTEKPVLAIDYVAIKDIKAGDELFMDYGKDWVAAWEAHVKNYKPHGTNPEKYASARWMNEHYGDTLIRTEKEQKVDPYPDNLVLRCHKGLVNSHGLTKFKFGIGDTGVPCKILRRDLVDGKFVYTVELEFRGAYYEEEEEEEHVTLIKRANVERSSIAFIDKPFTTNIHLPNAFRHPIGIPDEMFPEQWKGEEEEISGREVVEDDEDYDYAKDEDFDEEEEEEDDGEEDDDDELF